MLHIIKTTVAAPNSDGLNYAPLSIVSFMFCRGLALAATPLLECPYVLFLFYSMHPLSANAGRYFVYFSTINVANRPNHEAAMSSKWLTASLSRSAERLLSATIARSGRLDSNASIDAPGVSNACTETLMDEAILSIDVNVGAFSPEQ